MAASSGRAKKTAASGGIGARRIVGMPAAQCAADHVPGHTFASSTMPRGIKRYNPSVGPDDNDADDVGTKSRTTSMQAPSAALPARQTGASARLTPDDLKRPPYSLAAQGPQRSRELAAPKKKLPKQMIKPSRKGLFTAKAKAAGKSVQAYAAQVMANTKNFDPATVKQANFARNFGGAAKKRGGSS